MNASAQYSVLQCAVQTRHWMTEPDPLKSGSLTSPCSHAISAVQQESYDAPRLAREGLSTLARLSYPRLGSGHGRTRDSRARRTPPSPPQAPPSGHLRRLRGRRGAQHQQQRGPLRRLRGRRGAQHQQQRAPLRRRRGRWAAQHKRTWPPAAQTVGRPAAAALVTVAAARPASRPAPARMATGGADGVRPSGSLSPLR